jgi:hypothetical protein
MMDTLVAAGRLGWGNGERGELKRDSPVRFETVALWAGGLVRSSGDGSA